MLLLHVYLYEDESKAEQLQLCKGDFERPLSLVLEQPGSPSFATMIRQESPERDRHQVKNNTGNAKN